MQRADVTALEPLTSGQRARFDAWARAWTGSMPSTKPADFARAKAAALRCYALLGLPPPLVVLCVPSPGAAVEAGARAWVLLRQTPEMADRLPQGLDTPRVWYGRSEMAREITARLGDQFRLFVAQAETSWPELRTKLIRPDLLAVGGEIIARIGSAAYGSPRTYTLVETDLRAQLPGVSWGWPRASHDELSRLERDWHYHLVGRPALQTVVGAFLRDMPGLVHPRLDLLACHGELIASCGGVWFHESILVISDRPRLINLDQQARLHALTGASVAYRDGWSRWHVHGRAVPGFVIEERDRISVQRIDEQRNVELRRIMIEWYRIGEDVHGARAFMRDAAARCIDDDARYGKLWVRPLADDEALTMLEIVNATPEPDGTFKHYWLRVPPDMRSAREAAAWSFGLKPEDYAPAVET